MSYLDLSIKELHEALVKKEVTPLELVEEALKRAHSNQDNAFEFIDDEGAKAFASSLKEPEADNLLWGIPYVAKDNFSTEGIPTTASSNILNGYVPVFDATVIRKLKDSKAVMIAKATLDELAMGGTGTTGHLGKTFNPYDPSHKREIGGSSCGSAVSVAADIVPFALGSDTGDSVRKPASYAGLVGMKPTWGRISRYGLFPFAQSSVRKYEPASALWLDKNHSLTNEELKKHFDRSLEKLKEQGIAVDFVKFGVKLLESLYATYMVISCAEATSNDANLDGIKFGEFKGGKTYQEVMFNARNEGFSELIKRRFVIGSYCLMSENQEELFLRAQRNRAKIVETVNSILKDYDFIYVPAAPNVAPTFDAASDRLSDEYLIVDNHLCLGNFAGLPSITLPLFFQDGLPIGINFMGRAFEEKKLFQIANAFEKLSGLKDVSVLNKKEGNL